MDFIDVPGASGAAYRFRRWPGAGLHRPIAGNFVVVIERGRKIEGLGVTDDLSRAPEQLAERLKGAALFTRLNIARAVREAEHADLAAHHPDAEIYAAVEPHLV
ncbi:hypothetical protein LJR219_005017 [Phenylobacterium sp. LjRoot219]|uniref:hypothetical protein n=1 Tax=Phenylobacterium sp. LjRoot219 TaxID=3342283 RepID=UPI003ED09EF0